MRASRPEPSPPPLAALACLRLTDDVSFWAGGVGIAGGLLVCRIARDRCEGWHRSRVVIRRIAAAQPQSSPCALLYARADATHKSVDRQVAVGQRCPAWKAIYNARSATTCGPTPRPVA